MQVPIDQRVTHDPDWVVVPPDVPTALDDSDDGANGRDQDKHASVDVIRAFIRLLRLLPAYGADERSSGKH